MNRLSAALAVSLWFAPLAASAGPAAELHFPTANPADIARWIGPPPSGSAASRDMAELLAVQARRTPHDCAVANAAAELSIFDPFTEVFGKQTTAEAYPATTRLLAALVEDTFIVTAEAKAVYDRARPDAINRRVHPCIVQPKTSAYPSGHGLFIYTAAEAFAALVPERRAAIFASADTFAYQRIVGGIHFPSDASASRTAAALYYARASADPAFGPAFAAARQEFRGGLALRP